MSETIQTKRCSKCKQIKPTSDFYASNDKFDCQCKICRGATQKRYRKTKKGKFTLKRYNQSEKGKATHKRFVETAKGKTTCKRAEKNYRQTAKGKVVRQAILKRFFARNPNQLKAGRAVKSAIRANTLPRPDTLLCHYCPKPAQEYHHWHGYEPEHWLDVIPVCKPCHVKERIKGRVNNPPLKKEFLVVKRVFSRQPKLYQ